MERWAELRAQRVSSEERGLRIEERECEYSVLVDPEETDPMQLRELGDEHGEQGHCVDDKVDSVVLGVEAGKKVAGGRTGHQRSGNKRGLRSRAPTRRGWRMR